jgi:hypothetical protein
VRRGRARWDSVDVAVQGVVVETSTERAREDVERGSAIVVDGLVEGGAPGE